MAASSSIYPPPAFISSGTQTLMKIPSLARCGHLFDRAEFVAGATCPKDGSELGAPLHFSELEQKIREFRKKIPFSQKVWETKNAHRDDVHALVLTTDGFASGGKDGKIALWSKAGKEQVCLSEGSHDYTQWLTALTVANRVLVQGNRDGALAFWDLPSEQDRGKKDLSLGESQLELGMGHVSKERNQQRITCLAPSSIRGRAEEIPFFIGVPCGFVRSHFNRNTNALTLNRFVQVSKNDWVYCIHPLNQEETRLAVVIGAKMDVWEQSQRGKWELAFSPVVEDQSEIGYRGNQKIRPHISSLTPLKSDPNKIAYSCFEAFRKEGTPGDGPIRVVDMETAQRLFDGREHVKRSWCVVNYDSHLLATGADDQLIKLWDLRVAGKSCATSPLHLGRVSCLISPEPHLLIAASCPDNVPRSRLSSKGHAVAAHEGAAVTCWDVRQFKDHLPS